MTFRLRHEGAEQCTRLSAAEAAQQSAQRAVSAAVAWTIGSNVESADEEEEEPEPPPPPLVLPAASQCCETTSPLFAKTPSSGDVTS